MCSKTRRIWFFAVCAGRVEKAAILVVSWAGSRRPPPGPGCPPYEKGTRARPEKSFRRAIYRRVPESR